MQYIPQVIFLAALAFAVWFFAKNVKKLRRNILLGKDIDRKDQKSTRLNKMIRVALGQSKMVNRPVAFCTSWFMLVLSLLILKF